MSFKSLSIRTRLGLGFGTLALLVVLMAVIGIAAQSREHSAFTDYVNESDARLALANEILDASNARAIAARNLVLVTAAADIAAEKAAAVKAHEHVQAAHTRLSGLIKASKQVTARERELHERLLDVETRYGAVALAIVEAAGGGKRDEAVQRMLADCRPLLAELVTVAGAYVSSSQELAQKSVADADRSASRDRMILVAVVLGSVALSALLAFFITRSITQPIGEAVRLARTVASGDLSSRITVTRGDETGELLHSLQTMNDSLVRIVGRVREGSDSIATGSAQIATGNADLSQRTESQASSLEQTAAAMEQMNATVRTSAATAREASDIAEQASAAAQRGGQVVGEVVATMEQITESSRKISEIIGTIDGIAFQTNILALNAAVEAARAGEQGRGFAVVAGEVRTLAQRSAGAAREIRSLIANSTTRVDAGARLVGEAGSSMGDIVAQVQRVAGLITAISAAAGEQTVGIGQVNEALVQLDHATQQNAALVEQSAAAAESLKQQASGLAEVVSFFRLAGEAA